MILYSNNNTWDYTAEHCVELNQKGITGLICDFDPDKNLTMRLNAAGITDHYMRLKLYEYLPADSLLNAIKPMCQYAKDLDFHGFALDLEAYSNSPFWQWVDVDYYNLGYMVGKKIAKYFKEICIYPEYLGGDKYPYAAYGNFIAGLAETGLKIKTLMERTYNCIEPWNMLIYYKRCDWMKKLGAQIYLGVWQDSIKIKFLQKIQMFFAKLISGNKIFFYTEEKI